MLTTRQLHTHSRAVLQTSHCRRQQCHEAPGAVGSSCSSSILGRHRDAGRPRLLSQQALPDMKWFQQLSSWSVNNSQPGQQLLPAELLQLPQPTPGQQLVQHQAHSVIS